MLTAALRSPRPIPSSGEHTCSAGVEVVLGGIIAVGLSVSVSVGAALVSVDVAEGISCGAVLSGGLTALVAVFWEHPLSTANKPRIKIKDRRSVFIPASYHAWGGSFQPVGGSS